MSRRYQIMKREDERLSAKAENESRKRQAEYEVLSEEEKTQLWLDYYEQVEDVEEGGYARDGVWVAAPSPNRRMSSIATNAIDMVDAEKRWRIIWMRVAFGLLLLFACMIFFIFPLLLHYLGG